MSRLILNFLLNGLHGGFYALMIKYDTVNITDVTLPHSVNADHMYVTSHINNTHKQHVIIMVTAS